MVKTGPLWALATIRINTWSFQTQTSPLIVPVNVKLFWKGEKHTHHPILSKAGRKTVRNKHHLHLEAKLLLYAAAEEETVEEAIRTSRDETLSYHTPWSLKDASLYLEENHCISFCKKKCNDFSFSHMVIYAFSLSGVQHVAKIVEYHSKYWHCTQAHQQAICTPLLYTLCLQ